MNFIKGFICGIILKDHLTSFFTNLFFKSLELYHSIKFNKKSKKHDIYFIAKITDYSKFNLFFPNGKVQPSWDYYPKKSVIKIKINHQTKINTYFENITNNLDLPFFKSFADIYLFI